MAKKSAPKTPAKMVLLEIIASAGSMPIPEALEALAGRGVVDAKARHFAANSRHRLKELERAGLVTRSKGVAKITAKGKAAAKPLTRHPPQATRPVSAGLRA